MKNWPPWMKVLAAAFLTVAALKLFGHARMPGLNLARADSSGTVTLDECPTDKCLTIYVAPWCPHCRAAGKLIRAVRGDLLKRGVTTRIVVGMDHEENLENYAKEFGPSTLLDSKSQWHVGGVPAVYLSDNRGVILRHSAGLPEMDPPEDPAEMRQVEASYFGIE